MKFGLVQNYLGALALFVLLASCGPAAPQAGGGIGGTGHIASVVSGPITGFGSVFVSGYEYDTSRTSMTVDGRPGGQSDLKEGMLVRMNATVTEHYDTDKVSQRSADILLYEDTVEGVVQSVAPDGSSLVVLGQTVRISGTTIIDGGIAGHSLLTLVPDRDVIEVSGFVTGDGLILGTFVGLKTLDIKTQTPDYEVKGVIKNHKIDRKTFEIGALTIDYQHAILNDMPEAESDDLWDGLLVDVRGDKVSVGGLGPFGVRMIATKIWPEGLGTKESEAAEVEGIVTQVAGTGDFSIGNVRVQTNSATLFEGGAVSDVVIGAHLHAKGPLTGGILNASKVEIER